MVPRIVSQVAAAHARQDHRGRSGDAGDEQQRAAPRAAGGRAAEGHQAHQRERGCGGGKGRRRGGAQHAPEQRYTAQRQSDEQAVHQPAVVHHQVANAAREHQNGEGCGAYDRGEQQQRAQPEAQGRQLGDGVDEARVHAGGQQHGAPADAGDQVREPHERAADGAANHQQARTARVDGLVGISSAS
jgi:hypothetical protein